MVDRYELPTDTESELTEAKEHKAGIMVTSLINGLDAKCELDKEYSITHDDFMDEFISQWGQTELKELLTKFAIGTELGANSNRLEALMKSTAIEMVDHELNFGE